jgi:hypothetical protein
MDPKESYRKVISIMSLQNEHDYDDHEFEKQMALTNTIWPRPTTNKPEHTN